MFTHSPKIVTDGLVLCLDAGSPKSYGGSGTVWTDISRNGNNGTLVNGPTYSAANGGSIVFDGTNDYATIPNITGVTNFSIANNYTIDFWVYLNAVQNDIAYPDNDVIEKWSGSNGYPYVFRYIRDTQNLQIAIYDGSSANSILVPISHSKWWNICGVFNWSNSLLTIYGNAGNALSSIPLNLVGNITNTSDLNLMRRGNSQNYATGRLGNLKIYNRALSPAEIQQNFNALKGRYGL